MSRSKKCREVAVRRWAGRREYWQEMLELHGESGMSVSDFCKEMGVHPTSFYAWRQKFGAVKPVSRDDFVEISVAADAAHRPGIAVEFPGGIVVRPAAGCSSDELQLVLEAVRDVAST